MLNGAEMIVRTARQAGVQVCFANRSHNVLKMELDRFGVKSIGPTLSSLLVIENPSLDWVKPGESMGVPAVSVNTAECLADEILRSLSCAGPRLPEMVLY